MVVKGQKCLYWGKVVNLGQKRVYSCRLVVFGQSGYSGKVVVFGQRLLYSSKVVVFGKTGLYSGKKGCIWANEVVFGKVVLFG